MEFKETFDYPAGINRVWEMFSDPNYAENRAKVLNMSNPTVKSDSDNSTVRRTTTGGVPQELLPSAAKRFISPSTQVVLLEEWTRDGDNTINGRLEVEGKGVPASLKAVMTLTGRGDITEVVMHGDLRITVPLLGRKLEREAVGFAPRIAQGEVENAEDWLASHQ